MTGYSTKIKESSADSFSDYFPLSYFTPVCSNTEDNTLVQDDVFPDRSSTVEKP